LIGDAPVLLARNSAAKTPSPNPARIPPQTPPAGGKSAEAKRKILSPSQMFRPAESALVLLKKSSRKVYYYSTKTKTPLGAFLCVPEKKP